jgi:hypothetical protein
LSESDYDHWVSLGDVEITAGTSADQRFRISIDPTQHPGPLNFNPANEYNWRMLRSNTVLLGFSPDKFDISYTPSVWPAGTSSGHFFLSRLGNEIVLNYAPVPEPGGGFALVISAGLLIRRRRRLR